MARPGIGAKSATRTPRTAFETVFAIFVLVFFVALAGLAVWGGSFYATPLSERATHPLYSMLKPSGLIGRSLGITGTVMMLLIFLYSARKKSATLQRFGTQAQWLKVHIFLGVAGPLLVTFHTSGKLNGIVAIAFYSMWAMVLSGVVGRYLYAKIPRTISGNQMTLNEIETQLSEMVAILRANERREEVLAGIERFLGSTRRETRGLVGTLARVVRDDVSLPLAALRVFAIVSRDRSLGLGERLRVSRLVLRQKRLLNKLAVLDAMKRLFSYWHIFHKPFTVITFVIVFLHVGVTVFLGYGMRW
jgi:hypothetical protein